MIRKYTVLALSLLALAPVPARAGDMKAALSAVPSDAAAFVCLPNLKDLDGDVQRAITALGLDMFVQPPMNSVVNMLKMNMPMLGGLDESQPVAVVVMPITSIPELQTNSALLFSAADPKTVLEGLGGTVDESGSWAINVMGQSQFAAVKDKKIAIGQSPAIVKSVVESEASVLTSMGPGDLGAMDAQDLVIWVNGEKMFTPLKPMINGMLMMVMMQAQSSGSMTPEMMDQTREGFEKLVDGLGSLMIGVSVQDAGIGIRGAMTAKPDSELATEMKIKTTTGSLLTGLPGTTFMAAFGQVIDQEAIKGQVDEMDQLIGMATGAGVDEAHAKKLVDLFKNSITTIQGVRMSLEGLDSEKGGLFGFSAVVETSDAKRMIDAKEEGYGIIKQIVADLATKSEEVDAEMVTAIMDAMTFTRDAESIGGVSVSHFRIDHDKMATTLEADESDIATLIKVVGEEGLLFRAAAVNKTTFVSAFGGGATHFAKLVDAAKSKSAPLDANAGIKMVSANLPKARASAVYLDANEIMNTVQRVRSAVGEDALPLQLPKLDAPLAISSTGGNGWGQVDLFVPMALIRGIKDAVIGSAGGPPPAAAGQ